ncbi:MAG: sigma 54-interacting transcriptional regulator [Candidatus Rokuibacteriota bacterium]
MEPLAELLGQSPSIAALRSRLRELLGRSAAARRLPPILIQGETGTGKGLLARALHRAGPRSAGPFVDCNCAAIPDGLLESELFGYERGAFTDARQSKPGLFQAAHGGTLFLDEIGLLPRGLQPKLLAVLEERVVRRLGATRGEPVDLAIIAATNENLSAAVRAGRFREDLYHRLAVLPLELPPLRQRGEDVDLLAEHVLARVCAEYGLPAKTLSDDARAALHAYAWPGNVRELSNVLERALLLSEAPRITADALDLPGHRATSGESGSAASQATRERLAEALRVTGWNISRASAHLGIARNTVRARIQRYGLRPEAAPTAGDGPGAGAPEPVSLSRPEEAVAAAPRAGATVQWSRRRVAFLRARLLGHQTGEAPGKARILDRLVEKIQSFGGRVEELGQDGILAAFGHEPAEDAPRRAANAALAAVKAIGREHESGELTRDVGVGLGIHVQRVLLARLGARVELDRDSRTEVVRALDALEPLAAAEVVVSDAAAGVLERHLEMRRRTNFEAPGYVVIGRAAGSTAGLTPLVGRGSEIETLHELLDRAIQGRGQMVTIVGEMGVGKSRVVHEWRQTLPEDVALVREGRCAPYGVHVPYFPVLEILHEAYGIQEADSLEDIDRKVQAGLGSRATHDWAHYIGSLLDPRKAAELAPRSPEAAKARTFDAIRQLVVAEQERRPLVLIVEDLHWIDKTSEELLTLLAETFADTRVLVVTTCRPGYEPAWAGRSYATRIALGPLAAPESRCLVESILKDAGTTERFGATILTRAGGNPFFLEELSRAVQSHPDAETVVPATLHDVVAARIDGLPDAERRLLLLAAVIGRDVSLPLLVEASALAPDEVQSRIGWLQSAEFVYASRLGPQPEYAFRHAVTQEIAYDSLPENERPGLHERVALAIEKLVPETAARRPEVLARHWAGAGRHAEAARHWRQAGQLAMQRSAHVDAVAHLTRALELIERAPDEPARAQQELGVLLALATSLSATRGYGATDVERALGRARVLAERLGESPEIIPVRFGLWRFYFARADLRVADELARGLLGDADRQEPGVNRAAHVAAGLTKFYLGEFGPAREHLERALGFSSLDEGAATLAFGQDMRVAARGFLGWTLAISGELEAAARTADAALAQAREIDHPFSLALALLLAGEVYQLRLEPARVATIGAELLTLSREQHFTFFTAFGLMHSGWAESAGEAPGRGLERLREGADLFRAVGQRVGLAHRAHLGETLLAAGLLDEALGVVSDALRQSADTEERAFVAELHRIRGDALRQRSDAPAALADFREAAAVASRQGALLFELRAACALAHATEHGASGHRDALDALAALVDRFPPAAETSDLRTARTLLETNR